MKLLVALFAVSVIFYLSCMDWRRSVKALLVLIVLEGVLRKWVLPQASEIIYFLKDIVLFGAYFQYYGLSKKNLPQFKIDFFHIFLLLSLLWGLFQAFNPSLGSLIVGIWGLKNYFYYIPIIWMFPDLFGSEDELKEFLRKQLVFFIPVGILGIVQFFSPASSFINSYAPGLEQAGGSTALFGSSGNVRITGAFSYVNTYIPYLLFNIAILLVFLEEKLPTKQTRILVISGVLLVLNSFITGSRTIIFAAGLLFIGYFLIKSIGQFHRVWRILKWIVPPSLIMVAITPILFASEIETVLDRILLTSDLRMRLLLFVIEPIHNLQYKHFDSFGIGSTHQATPVLINVLNLPHPEVIPVGFESEMGRIVLEIGPIGFLLWYGLKISILVGLFILYWKLKRPFLRNLALIAFLIQGIWFPNQHVFHITFNVYYWFMTGFLYLLPHLEKVENWRQQYQIMYSYEQPPYYPDSSYR
ncbi:MAG: hypothetical protein J7545_00720 [Roseofilum sp. SBFL]|uniref:hypothetical protein n=1 Tax=unclassified Roseofilum TaxID=2620099 RepID=UPI001B0F4968|nr:MULTISPECIES: hypothetical protein [unclassified Roseofilum]MBP0014384.1 hypothetical protein [Roseofilum sp. SID3]MBP0025949.1 hypothetical protein [Roseofilum sp. SID2]MBP0036121.1 hypothetical protein [Roseofilum sp. SID1]MBP0040489.1 hypothetical protein [Roseofilum sp. SBFL]